MIDPGLMAAVVTAVEEDEQAKKPKRKRKIVQDKPLYLVPSGSVNIEESDPIGDALRADAVAYWKMDEASGTRVDSTSNGNDLNESDQVSAAAGKVNNAASLTNAASYLRRSGDTSFAFGNTSHAFAFWIRPSSLPSGADWSIFVQEDTGVSYEYQVIITDIEGSRYFAYNDWAFNFANSNLLPALSINTWYFVIFEYDVTNSKVRFFVNTQACTEQNIDTPLDAAGNRFLLGLDSSGLASIRGLIDEVLVLSRCTTSDERNYLYNSGDGRTLYP